MSEWWGIHHRTENRWLCEYYGEIYHFPLREIAEAQFMIAFRTIEDLAADWEVVKFNQDADRREKTMEQR